MSLDDIAPELRAPIGKLPRLRFSKPVVRWLVRNVTPILLREKQYAGVTIQKARLANGTALRIYLPEQRRTNAALLWIHGGGLVIGSPMQDDARSVETALELGIVVIATEYRLAPDAPFPAALDDCFAAWTWLLDAAQSLGVGSDRLAIGGQSAGGGLAAALVQRVHDAGGVQPVAQWLYCPMLDDRTAANLHLDSVEHLVWDNRENRFGWQAYLGIAPGSDILPEYASPARRKNLAGLPPAWIGCGDMDIFHAENLAYANRLQTAGVACTLDVVRGAPHGFESVARETSLARDYRRRARAWLGEQLGTKPRRVTP